MPSKKRRISSGSASLASPSDQTRNVLPSRKPQAMANTRGRRISPIVEAAGQSISDLLIEMKSKALAASDTSLDTASRQALNEDFVALRDQIASVVTNANFNGFNLVDGSTTQITALASTDGSKKITVSAENMSLGGSVVTVATTGSISTQSKASTMISTIQASLTNVDAALANLGEGRRAAEEVRPAVHLAAQTDVSHERAVRGLKTL